MNKANSTIFCMTCSKTVKTYQRKLLCTVCNQWAHKNCVTLNLDEFNYLKDSGYDWFCKKCLIDMFPYNNIENKDDFQIAVNLKNMPVNINTECLKTLQFNAFELNGKEFTINDDDIDPVNNFYNMATSHKCNYMTEDQVKLKIINLRTHSSLYMLTVEV